eukprot:14137050-Heterocapsa_arctica.AAC.1
MVELEPLSDTVTLANILALEDEDKRRMNLFAKCHCDCGHWHGRASGCGVLVCTGLNTVAPVLGAPSDAGTGGHDVTAHPAGRRDEARCHCGR